MTQLSWLFWKVVFFFGFSVVLMAYVLLGSDRPQDHANRNKS